MASEQQALISMGEFRTLNRRLDNAIADAVASRGSGRQVLINDQAKTFHARLTAFADEQRRLVEVAIQPFFAINTGAIGVTGATGALLFQTLEELCSPADRSLPGIHLVSPSTADWAQIKAKH